MKCPPHRDVPFRAAEVTSLPHFSVGARGLMCSGAHGSLPPHPLFVPSTLVGTFFFSTISAIVRERSPYRRGLLISSRPLSSSPSPSLPILLKFLRQVAAVPYQLCFHHLCHCPPRAPHNFSLLTSLTGRKFFQLFPGATPLYRYQWYHCPLYFHRTWAFSNDPQSRE